ncbi:MULTISPECIES: ArdC family protein [unclassified Devosia]|uniref:ArdC family protein n=1 Tax=unclassified Devosia TaxID=196773 RepID=UPI0025BD7169|nr:MULTISPECIES: ArdC family protein [unclassified Devosia]
MSTTASERRDLHAEITNQLIAAIEADPGKPSLPWRRGAGALHLPVNAVTGKSYSGINVLNLWVMAEVRHYATPQWATYKQWAERGVQVRKGEKASLVIFYKEFEGPTLLRAMMASAGWHALRPCSMPPRSMATCCPKRSRTWARSPGLRVPTGS